MGSRVKRCPSFIVYGVDTRVMREKDLNAIDSVDEKGIQSSPRRYLCVRDGLHSEAVSIRLRRRHRHPPHWPEVPEDTR